MVKFRNTKRRIKRITKKFLMPTALCVIIYVHHRTTTKHHKNMKIMGDRIEKSINRARNSICKNIERTSANLKSYVKNPNKY